MSDRGMLDRVLKFCIIASCSAIMFIVGYLIVDGYVNLHKRVYAIEELLQQPIEVEVILPETSDDYAPLI